MIISAAREEGLHDNKAIESRKLRVPTADVENIYLTETKIRGIAEQEEIFELNRYNAKIQKMKKMLKNMNRPYNTRCS